MYADGSLTSAGHAGTGSGSERVLVVDDHALLSQSLCTILRDRGMDVRALTPTTTAEVLDYGVAWAPDLVLLDLHLGEAGTSLPLVRPLSELGARVMMLTGSTNAAELGACLEAGATGVVTKNRPFDDLVKATTTALRGGPTLTERERLEYLTELWEFRGRQTTLMQPFTRLTHREEEVLHRLCEGESVHRVAAESHVSIATVRTQVRAVLQKLGATSQLEAVAAAYRSGWHIMQQAERAS